MTWQLGLTVGLGVLSFVSTLLFGVLSWTIKSTLGNLNKGLEDNKRALEANTKAVSLLTTDIRVADERHINLKEEVSDLCDRLTSVEQALNLKPAPRKR